MSFEKLCSLSDLSIGQGKEFLLNGKILAIFKLSENEVRAMEGMCAHQGGPIAQGQIHGSCVTCPWHGWQYDVRSGVNLISQKQMLATFPVEVRAGEVWVDAGEPAD